MRREEERIRQEEEERLRQEEEERKRRRAAYHEKPFFLHARSFFKMRWEDAAARRR